MEKIKIGFVPAHRLVHRDVRIERHRDDRDIVCKESDEL